MTTNQEAEKLEMLANELEERSERITRYSSSTLDGLLSLAAIHLREFAAEKRKAAEGHLAAQKRDGEGWQPIETAPNDGSRVLLWCKEWSASQSGQWYGMWWGSHALLSGWKYQPTHWMPLPLSPDQDREVSP